jgi:shikimate dehydrogenase
LVFPLFPFSSSYKSELVGVFGQPVAENPTIVMQEAGFKAAGLNFRYLNLEVAPKDLATALKGLRAMNFRGINLTIPHKVAVLKYLDEIAEDAKLIGAVNTVVRKGDKLVGENTDGKGFLKSLRDDANVSPKGKKVVILGAGGAARAIAVELALAGAAQITIVNRSRSRAKPLVSLLNKKTRARAVFISWTNAYRIPDGTDVLVNATSVGLYPKVKEKPKLDYDSVSSSMIVCDVIPNPPDTPFLQEARKRGAKTLDGLGMLVYQGAIGFKLWTGKNAPVVEMKKALGAVFK